jgi:hypothetical protein
MSKIDKDDASLSFTHTEDPPPQVVVVEDSKSNDAPTGENQNPSSSTSTAAAEEEQAAKKGSSSFAGLSSGITLMLSFLTIYIVIHPEARSPFTLILPTICPQSDAETYKPRLDADKSSEIGVNYNHLDNLLRKRKYREANQETNRIIFDKIIKPEKGNYVSMKDIQKVIDRRTIKDLTTINQLWNEHTNNMYGFNVQSCILSKKNIQIGSDKTHNDLSEEFKREVGWIEGKQQVHVEEMKYNDEAEKKGYLPRLSYQASIDEDAEVLNSFLWLKDNKQSSNDLCN